MDLEVNLTNQEVSADGSRTSDQPWQHDSKAMKPDEDAALSELEGLFFFLPVNSSPLCRPSEG